MGSKSCGFCVKVTASTLVPHCGSPYTPHVETLRKSKKLCTWGADGLWIRTSWVACPSFLPSVHKVGRERKEKERERF